MPETQSDIGPGDTAKYPLSLDSISQVIGGCAEGHNIGANDEDSQPAHEGDVDESTGNTAPSVPKLPGQPEVTGKEALNKIDLAVLTLHKCLADLSLANLENVYFLFHQILQQPSSIQAVKFQAGQGLLVTLGIKYILTQDRSILLEFIELGGKINGMDTTDCRSIEDTDEETQGILDVAQTSLTELQQSIPVSTLDTVTSLLQTSLAVLSPNHSKRALALATLAYATYLQFNHSKRIPDIKSVISMIEDEDIFGDPKKWGSELSLGVGEVLQLLAVTLSVAKLEIRTSRKTQVHTQQPSVTSQAPGGQSTDTRSEDELISMLEFAQSLIYRFQVNGDMQDLDDGIALTQLGLTRIPSSSPNFSGALNNIANALRMRFQRGGDDRDLDKSLSLLRQALELRPFPHPDRSDSLNNLANGLSIRFDQRRDAQDLDESILLYRQALELQPLPHPRRSSSLNNLANVLSTRFMQRGDLRDLDESILLHKQALDLRPLPHPNRSGSLNNLASGLSTRFEQQGDSKDLDEAILFYRQALELQHPSHPNYRSAVHNLANTLSARYQQHGDVHDLDQAILLQNESLKLLPLSHPIRPVYLSNFAQLHMYAYEKLKATTNAEHLDRALQLYAEATQSSSASPSDRFRNARSWARIADLHGHPSALEAFEVALGTLPQLVALGLDIQSRQDTLTKGTDGLARQAARCAIRAGSPGKAVELLEAGRSVFWSQFLSLRSPLDKLDSTAPKLAEDLRRIARELEQGSHRAKTSLDLSNQQKLYLEEEAQGFKQLANEWTVSVDKVRELDGYENFLRPQRLSTLQQAAQDCPIIYLVENRDSSDCLIMTSTGVRYIPLPDLGSDVLAALVQLVKVAASEYGVPRSTIGDLMDKLMEGSDGRGMRPERHVPSHLSSDDIFKDVLQTIWKKVVRPVIDALGLKKYGNQPTLTWCPTGLFTFLPIHAAGHYSKGIVDSASDYFASTYTPTIGILLFPKRPPQEPFTLMAVIQSRNLPSTLKELTVIEKHVSSESLIKLGTAEHPASVESVAAHLSTTSLVHFACHGKQDPANPLQSGLEIEGGQLTIARIMKETVPNGSLAFLSACETAVGDEHIPDEALNIGASLLLTGFQSVVATMWKMWDADGPVVADAFYRELFKGPDGNKLELPDTRRSAEALSVAVKDLRSRGVEFKRWVPFIHMGK